MTIAQAKCTCAGAVDAAAAARACAVHGKAWSKPNLVDRLDATGVTKPEPRSMPGPIEPREGKREPTTAGIVWGFVILFGFVLPLAIAAWRWALS